MKAKQHTLIVLLVFVLAAGAALALLTHANQKAEQAASEAEGASSRRSPARTTASTRPGLS